MAKKNANTESKPDYNRQEIMSQVCQLMAEGQSLRRICAAVEGMPRHSTICSWLVEDSVLADQYARARSLLADYRFDEYRDAAEAIVQQKLREGWEPKDAIAFARLETGNMQWEISKLAPKKYGEKITHAGDSENPLVVKHKHEMTEEELLAVIQGSSKRTTP